MIIKKYGAEISWAFATIAFGASMATWGHNNILDSRFFYTAVESQELFRSFTQTDRQHYFINEIFDVGFIISYTALAYLVACRHPLKLIRQIVFIPALLDMVETLSILHVLWQGHPGPPEWLGYVTCLKWLAGALATLLFVVFLKKSWQFSDGQ